MALIGIVAFIGYNRWTQSKQQQQSQAALVQTKTAKVTAGPLERRIRVAGQTAAKNYANVIAPMLRGPEGGRPLVIEKLAKSGSPVKKGEIVAVIDAQATTDHMDDVKSQVDSAESDIKKRKAELMLSWEQLNLSLKASKADYDKAVLDAKAAQARTEIEQMLLKLTVDETKARYEQGQKDLDSTKKTQAAQIRILEITKMRQERHYGRHVADLQKFTIKTPMDGLAVMQSIYSGGGEMRQIQEGDNVFPGQSFMKVVNPLSMQLEANINQSELTDFRVGQEARLTLDAFPGLEVKGKIYSLGAMGVGGWRQNFFIRNIPVKIQFSSNDPRLIPDLSGAGDVLVERTDSTVLAPIAALSLENGKYFAMVKKGETFEKREVKPGFNDGIHTQILSGLKSGEEVRIN